MGQVRTLPSAPGGSDFDAARVAAIREDIRAGRYEIHPERIASGLLTRVRDLLDPQAKP
jgi:negative regulator of flagellin synthesis FlgM